MAKIILITGGSRSGKSAYAQKMAEALPGPRAYVATCPVIDPEMEERVRKHREARRASDWETIEETVDLAGAHPPGGGIPGRSSSTASPSGSTTSSTRRRGGERFLRKRRWPTLPGGDRRLRGVSRHGHLRHERTGDGDRPRQRNGAAFPRLRRALQPDDRGGGRNGHARRLRHPACSETGGNDRGEPVAQRGSAAMPGDAPHNSTPPPLAGYRAMPTKRS